MCFSYTNTDSSKRFVAKIVVVVAAAVVVVFAIHLLWSSLDRGVLPVEIVVDYP